MSGNTNSTIELMETTLNLRKYRNTMSFAIGLLLLSILVIANILLMTNYYSTNNGLLTLLGSSNILILILYNKAFANSLFSDLSNRENLPTMIILVMLFPIGYGLNSYFLLINNNLLWFFIIGLGNIIIALQIEIEYEREEEILARPYLYAGWSLIPFFPVLLIVESQLGVKEAESLALIGFTLINLITTLVTIIIAERRIGSE